MISRLVHLSLVGILAVASPIFYLDINLIIMIVKEGGEYGRSVLWFQFATAILGSLVIWYACASIPKNQKSPAGKIKQFFNSTVSKIQELAASTTIGKILLAFWNNFRILIAGALLIFPGFITDSLGIIFLLWHVLFPKVNTYESHDKHANVYEEEPEIQPKDSRLKSSYENALSKLGSLAKKSHDMLSKVSSKVPSRANISSSLRAIPNRLSGLPRPKWGMNYLKKRRGK